MLKIFRPLTPSEVVKKQLTNAELDLLAAKTAQEHYAAQVAMLQNRVARLKKEIQE